MRKWMNRSAVVLWAGILVSLNVVTPLLHAESSSVTIQAAKPAPADETPGATAV